MLLLVVRNNMYLLYFAPKVVSRLAKSKRLNGLEQSAAATVHAKFLSVLYKPSYVKHLTCVFLIEAFKLFFLQILVCQSSNQAQNVEPCRQSLGHLLVPDCSGA